MALGTVKWYNIQKGYGFIQPDEKGGDVFVHASAVQRSELGELTEGERIQYEVVRDKRTGKSAADNLRRSKAELPPLAEFEAQKGIATFFRVDEESGKLVPDLWTGSELLLRDQDARDRHSELLRLLTALISAYDPLSPGANAVKFVIDDAAYLREALGSSIDEVRPGLLVPRGEVLRQIEAQQQTRDVDSDVPALGDAIRRSLRTAISAYNHFVQLDPELSRRDNALLEPGEDFVPLGKEEGLAIAKDLLGRAVVTEFTIAVLATEGKVAPNVPDASNRNSRRFSESIRNLVRAVVGKAVAYVNAMRKGTVKAIGAGVVLIGVAYGCGNWVLSNEVWLKGAFKSNPPMERVIDDLVEALKKLPLA